MGLILVSCWGPRCFILGSILGSILRHFGVILGHFGDLWATWDPLGAPWEERPDLGPRFEAFWDHFWDPLGIPWEPLGHPKGEGRGPKALTRGVSRGIRNQTPKMNHFGTPPGGAQVSSRLGESTVFKISGGGVAFEPLFGTILGPQEATMLAKRAQESQKGV